MSGTYRHTFDENHELNVGLKSSHSSEQEDNHYADLFRKPVQATAFDNTIIRNSTRSTEALAEYNLPLSHGARLEAGCDLTDERFAADFRGEFADPLTGRFVVAAGDDHWPPQLPYSLRRFPLQLWQADEKAEG